MPLIVEILEFIVNGNGSNSSFFSNRAIVTRESAQSGVLSGLEIMYSSIMNARNHHFVPQCYLRGFTYGRARQSKLTVLDRERQKHFSTIARNIGAVRDFNRLDMNGVDPNALESAYAKFEAELAPALVRIEKAGNLNNDADRVRLLNFVSLLAARNPSERERVNKIHENLMKRTMEIVVSSEAMYESQFKNAKKTGHVKEDSALDYKKLKKFVDDDEYTIVLNRETHIKTELDINNTILPYLLERKWSVVQNHGGTGFITSDDPVCLQWTERPKGPSIFPPGFALKGTEVIFPISKNLLTIGTFEGEAKSGLGWEGSIAYFNSIIAAHSYKQIFAADENFIYQTTTQAIGKGLGLFGQSFFKNRIRQKEASQA